MTTVNTATAAAEARVTAATVRTWCRRGAVAATKAAGRWAIDTASLARRIAIGARRHTRKAPSMTEAPLTLTSKTTSVTGHIGVIGPADVLEAAFRAGTAVTLSGKFAGERVHLGHTRQIYDDGIILQTIGLDRTLGNSCGRTGVHAIYLVNFERLDEAPRLAALIARVEARRTARAWAAEQRAADEENRYLNAPEA
ncbi:hypothetical protein [Streptomyces uncialis]|uniref:Uncharacterized protein n=2 Tax=Streptomyces TaxID=1883 RepID=A0A1Q4V104_9ACTN|nr:hypothetical protein [Streptomyces uncialis]OKH91518.1 hypothetical protein AB852_28600 [Streptomyces uncialis]